MIKPIQAKKIILLCCCLVALGITILSAQGISLTTGGDASGSGGSVSYSVGQVFHNSCSGGGFISEGAQQPFEILIMSTYDPVNTFTASIFPNPTSDFIIINIESSDMNEMSFSLFDTQGKLMQQQKIFNKETKLNMKGFPSLTYFLEINKSNEVRTFRIIKTK